MNNPINNLENLEEECGVTYVSLRNAEFLINKYGIPKSIELLNHNDTGFVVKAKFDVYGEHNFTGFSWGYGGEGPHGLMEFMRQCKFDIHISEIANLDKNNPQRSLWIPKTVDEVLI